MENKQYHSELTVFSGLAILFVLGIHASASTLGALFPDAAGYAQADWFLRIFRNLVDPAVPMFIFASGYKYYLHDEETPYFTFLKKRLPRVLMSFAIINTLFWALDSWVWMDSFNPILLLKTYISSWLGNTIAYPLWYIPMYCCVIIACPLVMRLIQNCWVRVFLYLLLGCAQRYVSQMIPIFGDKPFTFLSYPVFFEMGFIAGKLRLNKRISSRSAHVLAAAYITFVAVFSWLAPDISTSGWAKYFLYYIGGTLIYYAFCTSCTGFEPLRKLGIVSYPIFLLHEPVIGRLTSSLLQKCGVSSSLPHVMLWCFIVLCATLLLIRGLQLLRLDHILWNFRLNNVEKMVK